MKTFKDKILFVFGDSIMYGSGNGGFGVGEYLARDMGFRLYKYAIGGARVGYCEGKSWIPEQVKKALDEGVKPDYILFDGFTNDCNVTYSERGCDVELGEMPQGYDSQGIYALDKNNADFSLCFDAVLFTLLKEYPLARLLFIRPHNMGRRDDKLQKLYGERALCICEKWGVPYVDLYNKSGMNTFIPEHRDMFTNDGYGWGRGDCTHPNAAGYEIRYMPLIEAEIKNL